MEPHNIIDDLYNNEGCDKNVLIVFNLFITKIIF